MLAVVCWKWRGWRDVYTAAHVNAMRRMLQQHLTIPHKFVCITDDPAGIAAPTFPLWMQEPAKLIDGDRKIIPNCFTRLRLFDHDVNRWLNASTILSIDLDTVLLGNIDHLITGDDFKSAKGEHSHVCGTLWQLNPGAHEQVWQSYDPVESPKIIAETKHEGRAISGSDQAWMSIQMPDAPTWGEQDGVYWFKRLAPKKIPDDARLVYFAGGIKPWDRECKMINPRLYDEYMKWL